MLLSQTRLVLSRIAAAGLAAVAVVLGSCSRPPTAPLAFAPAAMTVRGPHTTSADGGVTFWGDGSVGVRLHLAPGPAEFAVEARGAAVAGEAPVLEVRLDGRAIGAFAVSSATPEAYRLTAAVLRGGETEIEVAFVNYLDGGTPLASRVVYLRRLSVRSPAG